MVDLFSLGNIFGLLSGFFWGLNGVLLGIILTRPLFSEADGLVWWTPLIVAAIHDSCAAVWLSLYNFIQGKFSSLLKTVKTRPGMVVCLAALCGGPLSMSAYLLAIKYAGPAYTLIITANYPAVGAILANLLLKEEITPRVKLGILFSIIGTVFVGYTPATESLSLLFWMGIGLAFIPAVGWALEGVLVTSSMKKLDAEVALNLRQLTSSFFYLFVIITLIQGHSFLWKVVQKRECYYLFMIALTGAVSYLLWYKAMNKIGVGRAMVLNMTYALWVVVIGFLFQNQPISWSLIIGGLFIVLGASTIVTTPAEKEEEVLVL